MRLLTTIAHSNERHRCISRALKHRRGLSGGRGSRDYYYLSTEYHYYLVLLQAWEWLDAWEDAAVIIHNGASALCRPSNRALTYYIRVEMGIHFWSGGDGCLASLLGLGVREKNQNPHVE